MSNTLDKHYAHLPEELLEKILEAVPKTVDKMNSMFSTEDEPIKKGIDSLRQRNMISSLSASHYTDSLIAVDGSNILEKMIGNDIILAVALGVEGLTQNTSVDWQKGKNQYYQWQTVLPHDEATPRLCQGVMFLMELSVLANSSHRIRIMDGTHFTPLLKINSMLSAYDEKAGDKYVDALRDFLQETYNKIIPDIPDIVETAFNDNAIIAIAKYSSSTDITDSYLKNINVSLDDKTFFSLGLDEREYLVPLPVGQSEEERKKIWDDLHIKCNLQIHEKEKLNNALREAILSMRTKDHNGRRKESELYFTYFKPYQDGPAYRIECKKAVAEDKTLFEEYLESIRRQIVFPEIREPFPQYLGDIMAKSVSGGLYAIQEAIRLSPSLRIDEGRFNLLFPYRT